MKVATEYGSITILRYGDKHEKSQMEEVQKTQQCD